ncbi:hypothetical protein IWQ60_009409 [Tieghemiomyces parasiticus]|uniref:G-patch domain-containing protein n=1 Tax=Tieghemiomyces parasiticus TaxID=78921 RepID=A0A9W7ZP93_9FUNG|nr:hypothetical protein IWQ60_009409 [Tieghemiomyces parasiticus]
MNRGQGLGRDGFGIKKHISVSKKSDVKGVGANRGDYEFAWWDHVYNKSAAHIKVDAREGSVKVEASQKIDVATEKKVVNQISTNGNNFSLTATGHRSSGDPSACTNPAAIWSSPVLTPGFSLNMFVKSSTTYTQDDATAVKPVPDGNTAKPSEREQRKAAKTDYRVVISDRDLFVACGGRTARKGARSEQRGKLKRVDPGQILPLQDTERPTLPSEDRHRAEKDRKKKAKKDKKLPKKADDEGRQETKEIDNAVVEKLKVKKEGKAKKDKKAKNDKKAKKDKKDEKKSTKKEVAEKKAKQAAKEKKQSPGNTEDRASRKRKAAETSIAAPKDKKRTRKSKKVDEE